MKVRTICVFFILASVYADQNESGISGTISVAPAHPGPIRVGESGTKPLSAFEFVVKNESGQVVASFKTNGEGHFEVRLPAGHYTVQTKEKQSSIGQYGPWEVDVAAGKMTAVEWRCDSGMR
jgi:hypothetical protein